MKKAPDGRPLYLPKGRDPTEDLCLLADTITASDADLFDQGDSAVWLTDGKCAPVSLAILREICMKFVASKVPVLRAGQWQVTYPPLDPPEMTLRAMISAREYRDGNLACRLPKMPAEPMRLSARVQEEVRQRLAMGEPKDRVAAAYRTDVATIETIRQLMR